MVSPRYGVYWIDSYNATDDPNQRGGGGGGGGGDTGDLLPDHLRTGRDREILGPGEHPFPTKYAVRMSNLSIEPSIYLDALVRDFLAAGGRIVIRKFDTPRDLMSLSESIIVNSTGLGSKTLFNDEELVPVKGQLSLLVPQPEVNYRASGRAPGNDQPGGNTSINPRTDGIVVGNLMERGNWSTDPDEEVRRRNVAAAVQFFAAMRAPAPGAQLARSEPPRVTPSLESFFDVES
jgi:glycine/D-amino acid oxidase-like deaminating enzyme